MKTLAPALALLLFALPAAAQQAPETPILQANGEGRVMVVPDIAVVSIGVVSRAATAGEALRANSTDLAEVIKTILAAGVADKDVGTSSFSVSPLYEQPPERPQQEQRPPRIVGYQVANEVRVTIRDIASSGGILDQVVEAGANQLSGISFDIAERRQAEDEALKAAIAEARRQAEIMAEAAGVRLVRVLSVSASSGGGGPVYARMEMAAAPPVPVMPGEQAVTANASVTWEIAPQ